MTKIEPHEPDFDPARWDEGDRAMHFERGVSAFDAGEYHAAHEEFEKLWLSTQGSDSDFFKGLIQACIALHHFQHGNLEGAAKLYSGHRRYLAAYLPVHRGIDVAALLTEMQRALRLVVRRVPAETPVYDASQRPKMRARRT